MTSLLNKREGEIAGIRSSVSSLEDELQVIRAENEELEKLSSTESRRNRDLVREVDSLRSNLSIEKGEVDNLTLKNQILQESQSRPTTPSRAIASPGSTTTTR